MISNILILKTQEDEIARRNALQVIYDDFVRKLGLFQLEKIDNNYLFLKIDLRSENYTDEDYLVNINNDPKILEYGISCSDIVQRINQMMKDHLQPYRCNYAIDWHSGKGICGRWRKIRGIYPFVKSVNFMLRKVVYSDLSSSF